jgi:hypothetical protein
MTRIARLVALMTGTAVLTLVLTSGPAAATRPAPDGGPPQSHTVAQRVEVPVPVPADATAELIQMAVAAALAAAVATGATTARLRRRHLAVDMIDITDTVARPSRG